MQKFGKISDKHCHNMAIEPLYAIKHGGYIDLYRDWFLMVGAWFVDVPGGINGFWNRMLYGHPSHHMGEPTFPSWYRLLNGVNFWVTCCGVEGRLELPHIFYTLCFWKYTAFTLSPRHIIIVTIASDWVVKHSDIIKYVSVDLTYQCNNH